MLWPALYLSALVAYLLDHAGSVQPFVLIILPIAQTAQAIIGALLLKKFKFDPMLNHVWDGIIIFFVAIGSAIVAPAFGMLAYFLNRYFFNTTIPALTLGSWWGGPIFFWATITIIAQVNMIPVPMRARTWMPQKDTSVSETKQIVSPVAMNANPATTQSMSRYFLSYELLNIALLLGRLLISP